MHEVDMLCDNVGIINTGNLVAYDTPQGLKDRLLKEQKIEYEENIKSALSKIYEEDNSIDEEANEVVEPQVHQESEEDSDEVETLENKKINSKWADRERDAKLVKELHLREMSFLVKNLTDTIVDSILENENVYSVDIFKNERVILKIESFNENVITDILKVVVNNGGLIESIYTQEPSLEDVFIKATAEVDENARA